MKRFLQKISQTILVFSIIFQTIGVLPTVAAEREVTAQQFQEDEAIRVQNQKKVIGYFVSEQGYRTDIFPDNPDYGVNNGIDGKGFDPVNVNMEQLTHLHYAYIVIDENGLPTFQDPALDTAAGRNYVGQLTQLTSQHEVTFMMAVGGQANSLAGAFNEATATPEKMNIFTDALVAMMLEYGFDGIDINWEHPENDDQKVRFIALIQQLREKLNEAGINEGNYYQLSAAVTAHHEQMNAMAPSEVHPYLDFINVMTYDFRGPINSETGHHSPLHPRANDADQKLNLAAALTEYVGVYQVPENKLVVGMGYHSRGWSGVDSVAIGAFASGTAIGVWDEPNDPSGLNPWFHLKGMEQDPQNIVNWDDQSQVPYLYNTTTNEFFTYENPRSLQYKVDYIFERDFGGAMIRDLSQDTTDYELGSIVATILDQDNWPIPEPEYEGTEGLKFSFDSNQLTAAVTGYTGSSRDVMIPATVTYDQKEYVVTSIGAHTFQGQQLTNVGIPNSVTTIGNNAFNNNRLTHVTIPNSVTTIGSRAFSHNQLTHIELSNSLTRIETSTFTQNQLTHVTIPNSVTYIGSYAFQHNQLTTVSLPNSIATMAVRAFANNQLTTLVIPNSVTILSEGVFADNQITHLTLTSSINSVHYGPFRGSPLQYIDVPTGLAEQMSRILTRTNAMVGVNTYPSLREGTTSKYEWDGNSWIAIPEPTPTTDFQFSFHSNGTATITNYIGSSLDIIIPSVVTHNRVEYSITNIERPAFQNKKLTSVKFPVSITHLPDFAFAGNYLGHIEFTNPDITFGTDPFRHNQIGYITIPEGSASVMKDKLNMSIIGANSATNVTLIEGRTPMYQSVKDGWTFQWIPIN